MKHIKKAISYSVAGTLGLTVVASLNGCSDQGPTNNLDGFGADQNMNQEGNFFLVIEQTGSNPDTFKVLEKHATSGPTRAILRSPDGTERFLSQDELKRIAEEEAARVEAGTSRLTQDGAEMSPAGMSLGETLLAAAAGSLIGGMLANSLMGNRNFQRHQSNYGGGRPNTQISRSATNTSSSKTSKSGFFGGNKSGTSSNRSSFGSFGG